MEKRSKFGWLVVVISAVAAVTAAIIAFIDKFLIFSFLFIFLPLQNNSLKPDKEKKWQATYLYLEFFIVGLALVTTEFPR